MRYYKESEFNMGGEVCFDKMNPSFLTTLDEFREFIKRPVIITSSYRDEAYNKLVGGSKSSQHLLGNAVDISTIGWSSHELWLAIKFAIEYELSFGVSKNFIHFDCRNTQPKSWTY